MITSELRTEPKPTGEYWYFDNGQYAEKIPINGGWLLSLSYHYNRVYVNYRRYNDCGQWGGFCGIQSPLSSVDKQFIPFARILFQKDKKNGVIPESYEFK